MGGVLNPLVEVPNKFDLLDELQRQKDDEIDEEGYTIDKDLIVEAWTRFRPVNKGEQEDGFELQRQNSRISRQQSGRRGKPRTQ